METALLMYIFDLANQDKSYMGISRSVFLIFLTIGSLIGGPIGEKFNKKSVLIFCELVRIPFIILLFFVRLLQFGKYPNGVAFF